MDVRGLATDANLSATRQGAATRAVAFALLLLDFLKNTGRTDTMTIRRVLHGKDYKSLHPVLKQH